MPEWQGPAPKDLSGPLSQPKVAGCMSGVWLQMETSVGGGKIKLYYYDSAFTIWFSFCSVIMYNWVSMKRPLLSGATLKEKLL